MTNLLCANMNLFGKLKYRSEKLKMHVIKKVKIYCYFSTVNFSLAEPCFKILGVEAATAKKSRSQNEPCEGLPIFPQT